MDSSHTTVDLTPRVGKWIKLMRVLPHPVVPYRLRPQAPFKPTLEVKVKAKAGTTRRG